MAMQDGRIFFPAFPDPSNIANLLCAVIPNLCFGSEINLDDADVCREQTVPSISEHHLACCGVGLCTAYAYAPQCTRKLRSWPDFSTRIPWDSGKHGLHACTQNSATGKLLLYYPLPKRSSRSSLCVNIWRIRPAASAGKCPKEVSRPAGSKSEAPTAFSSLHFCLLRALDPMCVLKRPFARFPRIDHRSRDGGGICGEMKGILHQQHFSALSHERFFVAK